MDKPDLFKKRQFEKTIILVCVRWYLRYPLSYRNLEEMMQEREDLERWGKDVVSASHRSGNLWQGLHAQAGMGKGSKSRRRVDG